MTITSCILALSVLAADGPVTAKVSVAAARGKAEAPGEQASPGGGNNPADRRDVLLLLDSGPLHLRFHLSLSGVSLAEARRQYVARLINSLDANRDGQLSREEASKSPLLRTKSRPGASEFLQGLGGTALLSARDVDRAIDRWGGESVAYRQDLSSAKNDQEVFKLLDADSNGLLDQKELDASADLVLSKDDDGDECVSFEEFFPPPTVDPMQVLLGLASRTPPPTATVADIVRDTQDLLLPRRLLTKYDRNRDLQLTAGELNWPPERIRSLDTDGNDKLSAQELAGISRATPDMELSADLKPTDANKANEIARPSEPVKPGETVKPSENLAPGEVTKPAEMGGAINVRATTGQRLDSSERADYAKVAFPAAVLTFSHRNIDPIASAVENAMRQFNQLDTDANGYLDRDETAQRNQTGVSNRFERGLFELMDADGDDKVFADEMKQYVAIRCEPAATTCRVNVYDTGYGFFMAIDANADGRVSVRELRHAARALADLDRDRRPGIGEKEPVRHFHIEFVRGSYQLFGPSEQLAAQTPAFQQRRPIGPIWFQRMDRNNDGDLTWNEFLGPREVFHALDRDSDGLVDPKEAGKAR